LACRRSRDTREWLINMKGASGLFFMVVSALVLNLDAQATNTEWTPTTTGATSTDLLGNTAGTSTDSPGGTTGWTSGTGSAAGSPRGLQGGPPPPPPSGDTSTQSNPTTFYVTSSNTGLGVGTSAHPFFSIGSAFSAAAEIKYSRIYLLKGTHSYVAAISPLTVSLKGTALTMSTLLCASSTHSQCASSAATVTVASTSLQVSGTSTQLTYSDIIFSGNVNLDNCSGDYCTYCPNVYTFKAPAVDRNDKGDPITSYAATCSSFRTLSFIRAGNLTLTRVNFSYMRQQFRSLIEVTGGSIEMTDTNFDHVQTYYEASKAIITLQNSGKIAVGFFIYKGGSVTYMNNGYEYLNQSIFGNFAMLTMVNTVEVQDVTFQWNVSYLGESDTGKTFLLGLSDCPSMSITKTSFLNNMVDYAMIYITTSIPVNPSQADVSKDTLILQDLTFKNSGGRVNGGLYIEYSGGIQNNILVKNVTVQDCATGGTFFFINFGTLSRESTTGYEAYGDTSTYFVPPRVLTMVSVTVSGLYASTALITVSGISNPTLSDISITSSGIRTALILDPVMTSLLANSNIYMKVSTITISVTEASALMSLKSNYNLSLSGLTIDNCEADNGVVLVSVPNYSCTVEDFTAESNVLGGSMLSLSGWASCKVNSITMTSIITGTNVLSSALNRIELTNAKFIKNTAPNGALLLSDHSITIVSLTCTLNEGTLIGCLSIELLQKEMTPISIKDTEISFNKGLTSAPGIALTSIFLGAQVNLQLSNVKFTSNIGLDGASAIQIDSSATPTPESFISNSLFIQNTSEAQGALTILSKQGSLAVVSCTFKANYSSKGAAVYFDNETILIFALRLTSSSFTENTSRSSVVYASTTGTSTLTTTSCTFSSNKTTAVYIIKALWTDSGSTFLSNQATQAPGVYASEYAGVTLVGASFKSNVSSTSAGAVYVGNQASFACNSCTFEANTAALEGGAVYIEKYSPASFNKTDFTSNSGKSGAAVYMLFTTSTTFDNCTFTANAGKLFGALTANEAKLTLRSCTLNGNTAPSAPGISLVLSTVEIYDTSFENQTSESTGAFLNLIAFSEAKIVGSSMDNVQGKGPAIEVGLNSLTIVSSTITNSYSTTGDCCLELSP
jgi:hypothetical protein